MHAQPDVKVRGGARERDGDKKRYFPVQVGFGLRSLFFDSQTDTNLQFFFIWYTIDFQLIHWQICNFFCTSYSLLF